MCQQVTLTSLLSVIQTVRIIQIYHLVDSSVRLNMESSVGLKLTLYGGLSGDSTVPSKQQNKMIKPFNAEEKTSLSLDLQSEIEGYRDSAVDFVYLSTPLTILLTLSSSQRRYKRRRNTGFHFYPELNLFNDPPASHRINFHNSYCTKLPILRHLHHQE